MARGGGSDSHVGTQPNTRLGNNVVWKAGQRESPKEVICARDLPVLYLCRVRTASAEIVQDCVLSRSHFFKYHQCHLTGYSPESVHTPFSLVSDSSSELGLRHRCSFLVSSHHESIAGSRVRLAYTHALTRCLNYRQMIQRTYML